MEKSMSYEPSPIDTSGVVFSENIESLLELLARNTHEVWAKERISDGWTWGPIRDDVKKEHPCLIPYDMLSEDEKQYDRNISGEVLKTIMALGCRFFENEKYFSDSAGSGNGQCRVGKANGC